MSWGERSCKYFANPCPYGATFEKCHAETCQDYVWNGKDLKESERQNVKIRGDEIIKQIRYSEMSKSQKRKFRKKR